MGETYSASLIPMVPIKLNVQVRQKTEKIEPCYSHNIFAVALIDIAYIRPLEGQYHYSAV
jgi:hypothetical protein